MTREALEGFLKAAGPVGLTAELTDKMAAERADQFLALFGETEYGFEATFTNTGEFYDSDWDFTNWDEVVAYCEEKNREEDEYWGPDSPDSHLHCKYVPKARITVKARIEVEP